MKWKDQLEIKEIEKEAIKRIGESRGKSKISTLKLYLILEHWKNSRSLFSVGFIFVKGMNFSFEVFLCPYLWFTGNRDQGLELRKVYYEMEE